MKINLDLTKIGQTALKFTKDNPVLCIGTAIGGYMFIRNYFRTKHIEKEIDNLKSNSLVQETIKRMK